MLGQRSYLAQFWALSSYLVATGLKLSLGERIVTAQGVADFIRAPSAKRRKKVMGRLLARA